MNKTYLAGSILLAMAGAASAYTVTGFRVTPPVSLVIPAVPDSLQKENPFDKKSLLDSRSVNALKNLAQDWTTILPDTAGHFHISAKGPALSSAKSRIRANRFAKGKLVLHSSGMADLLVNGTSLAKKSTSDSIPTEVSGAIELLPEAVYDITVNLLSLPDDKGAGEFMVEFVPDEKFKDVTLESGPAIPERFTPLHTMIGERVSSVSLSPDGKYLLTFYAETLSASKTLRHCVLSEPASGKILNSNLPWSSKWAPVSNSIYYTSGDNDNADLYRMDLPAMTTARVASGIPSTNFTLSPDGKYFYYYKIVEGTKDEGVMRRVQSPDDRIPGNRDRYYIMRYELASGVSIPLTYGGGTTSITDFTADGRKMLYMVQRQTPSEYPFYLTSLIQMDLSTFATDTIIADNGYITGAVYSPDAKRLFITGAPQAFGEIGVNAGNHPIPNAFDNQGFIYDIASGKVTASTRDFDPAVEGSPVWNRIDNKIYFRGETGFYSYLYRLDPASGKIDKLDSELGYVMRFSMGDRDGRWLAYVAGDFTDTGAAWLMDVKTGKQQVIADPMSATLKDVKFGKMEPWKFTYKDGTEIDGFMCLPPDFDPSKKYPLIVYYYGGTSPSTAAMHHLYSPQVFASRDYVVYVINPSGTTGYGQEFSARHVNAWGKQTAEEIIDGVKRFCDAHPFVDRKKIGCLGASYGGFMTQYLQNLNDIFAAAVSHAGISNVTSYWGEGFWGYSYNSVAAAKSYPWTDPELYTKQGSLFNADKIHTPLLLLHGTQDTNVPIGESIQLFNALRVLGREVEFITVEDENHVISNFDRKQLWQNTIMAWFAKWLQDDPRWWNSLYGND